MTVMGGTSARGRMVTGSTTPAMSNTTTVRVSRATGGTTTRHDNGNARHGDGNG